MKKLIKILFILLIIFLLGYYIYENCINKIPTLKTEDLVAEIQDYHMYGNHLNIEGTLSLDDKNYKEIKLILYNGKEKEINIITNIEDDKINFKTSEYLNEGIYLDDLPKGIYSIYLKVTYEDKDKDKNKYYRLNNKTTYNNIEYYTISKYNNKIIIQQNKETNTMEINIKPNKNKDIYDITIDPGHGGVDSGAVSDGHKEKDYTMTLSTKIKEKLEKQNIKVKMTHTKNELSSDKYFDEYNKHGRAVIPNEVKSKYTISIHINQNSSKKLNGIEIYTPDKINYDFAKSLATSIVENTSLKYSTQKKYKMYNGVYTHNFTKDEILAAKKGHKEKGYKPFNITDNSSYLYMIRETGGYMTGAYVDDSNPKKVGVNPYYNSNIGNESYLIEVGYISNQNDVNILDKESDSIADSISNSIINELKQK